MAEEETKPAEASADDENALETLETAGSAEPGAVVDATSTNSTAGQPAAPPSKKSLKDKLRRFNIYLLLFLFIMLVAGVIVVIAYFQSKKASTTSTLKTQTLTQQALQQVANSDASVGNAQSVLNVQSSAVFAGKVLVREGLEVAGNLQIGGTVALNNIAVSGTSQLGQVSVSKDLAVSGNTAIQGSATIAKSLQVNGGASFAGPISAPQIATSNLQLNADLVLTHHITAGGGTPSSSSGPALGSGGSATVNGSDTAGTATINIGSSPTAGCFITITFTAKYSQTPHVLLTPVGSGAGGLAYYVTRTSTTFSICDSSAPPSGTSFAYDYFVLE